MQKVKDEPFVPIGIFCTFAMIAHGIKQYKNRGNMSTSMYIMKYRVIAQSMVVGAMTIGVTYQLCRDWWTAGKTNNQNDNNK